MDLLGEVEITGAIVLQIEHNGHEVFERAGYHPRLVTRVALVVDRGPIFVPLFTLAERPILSLLTVGVVIIPHLLPLSASLGGGGVVQLDRQ
jgi:hypothetical protein